MKYNSKIPETPETPTLFGRPIKFVDSLPDTGTIVIGKFDRYAKQPVGLIKIQLPPIKRPDPPKT